MLNSNDVSEYLKISPHGLEVKLLHMGIAGRGILCSFSCPDSERKQFPAEETEIHFREWLEVQVAGERVLGYHLPFYIPHSAVRIGSTMIFLTVWFKYVCLSSLPCYPAKGTKTSVSKRGPSFL